MPGDASAPRRISAGRIVLLVATAGSLYLLAPSVSGVLASWPKLSDVSPLLFAGVVALQVASFCCVFVLQRLALRTSAWFPVVTSQVAGNAFSRIVPGGAAAGAALQFRMLSLAGADTTSAVTGLTAFSLLQTVSVLALPLFTLPTMLGGAYVNPGLAQAAMLGIVAFVVVAGLGVLVLAADWPLVTIARMIVAGLRRLPRRAPVTGLPERLLQERDAIRHVLGARWWEASLATAGRLGFDFLSLLLALGASGADRPNPSLILLAFAASSVLSMVPITPGGLGFVEAGLTATLTLTGLSAYDAVLATLVYRMASYWIPIAAGPVAYAIFQRRYGAAAAR